MAMEEGTEVGPCELQEQNQSCALGINTTATLRKKP